ncbi:MAG: flagellar hook-basal body complex protein [Rhodospirillaceae bacterium]|jgi:flagellar hook protein FlgE|nr:flagellar hook-basal body complex protein [Rhodospirillaceae bacterium]MBT6218962.1 flagellar hook-basal body complex protein [Rhodospirillaceae bacterium]
MSLFGALSSGVSGLTAQSSAMGAISDNITNVSTIGYKNTRVDFSTLVTKQSSSTLFSPGGVQSRPRQDTGVQGLLQASTSSTDIAISGNGYYVVNESPRPGVSDQFLFSRAGSFFQDNEGFLRNTSGFYLQAWPTDAAGKIVPANDSLSIANQNILSTDFLDTINLSNVGGTATATSAISIGANLPANDTAGTTHRTDVQFFDSLGNPNNISFQYTKANVENQWRLDVDPPQGTAVLTLEDPTVPTAKVYGSTGQLEFNVPTSAGDAVRRPADGATIIIDAITYQFDDQPANFTAGTATTTDFQITASTLTSIAGTFSKVAVGDVLTIQDADTAANLGLTLTVTAVAADGSNFTFTPSGATTVDAADSSMVLTLFNAGLGQTSTLKRVDISSNTSLSQDIAALVAAVKASDSDFADDANTSTGTTTVTNTRIAVSAGSATTILFKDDGRSAISVNPAGLLDSSGTLVTAQKNAFTVKKRDDDFTDEVFFKFNAQPSDTDTITVNGIVYEFDSNATTTAGNKSVTIGASVAATLTNLVSAIEANDASFASGGTRARLTASNAASAPVAVATSVTGNTVTTAAANINVALPALVAGSSFTILADGVANVVTFDGTATTATALAATITGLSANLTATVADGAALVITAANGRAITITDGGNSAATALGLISTSPTVFNAGSTAANSAVLSSTADTLVLTTLPNNPANNNAATNTAGTYSAAFSNAFGAATNTVTRTDQTTGSQTTIAGSGTGGASVTIQTKAALKFSADGLPSEINIKDVEVLDFANGANDLNDQPTGVGSLLSNKIEMNFGTLLEANGFTQFGAEFTPVFIQQNGSRFGNFAGVTVNSGGQVVALFDNGETRNIYQIPLATFVNVNQLESKSGNVWNATEASGDATLREADTGPAGSVIQGSLEASTVDIGEEFTKMIVVQRAFSASAKIISTADDMLEELLRTKR